MRVGENQTSNPSRADRTSSKKALERTRRKNQSDDYLDNDEDQSEFVDISLSQEALELMEALDYGDRVKDEAQSHNIEHTILNRLCILLDGLNELACADEIMGTRDDANAAATHITAIVLDSIVKVSAFHRIPWDKLRVRIETRRIEFQTIESPRPSVRIHRGHFRIIVVPVQNLSIPTQQEQVKDESSPQVGESQATPLDTHTTQLAGQQHVDHILKVRFSTFKPGLKMLTKSTTQNEKINEPKVELIGGKGSTKRVNINSTNEIFERLVSLLGVERVQWDRQNNDLCLLLDGALYDTEYPHEPVRLADFSFRHTQSGVPQKDRVSLLG